MQRSLFTLALAGTITLATLLTQAAATESFMPTTAAGQFVYVCATIAGVDTTGRRPMTLKEMRDTTTCVDRVRAALAKPYTPTTAAGQLVYVCATAIGINTTDNHPMTPKEVRLTTSCVDLVRTALAMSK